MCQTVTIIVKEKLLNVGEGESIIDDFIIKNYSCVKFSGGMKAFSPMS